MDQRREVWEEMLGRDAVEEIYSSHSSEEEKLYSCADTYVTCKPDSSWEELVQVLYDCGERAAAKEAKAFLQQNGVWIIVIVPKLANANGAGLNIHICIMVVIFWHLAIDYVKRLLIT